MCSVVGSCTCSRYWWDSTVSPSRYRHPCSTVLIILLNVHKHIFPLRISHIITNTNYIQTFTYFPELDGLITYFSYKNAGIYVLCTLRCTFSIYRLWAFNNDQGFFIWLPFWSACVLNDQNGLFRVHRFPAALGVHLRVHVHRLLHVRQLVHGRQLVHECRSTWQDLAGKISV